MTMFVLKTTVRATSILRVACHAPMTIPVLETTLKCLTLNDQYALTPFWVMFSPADMLL